MTTFMATKSKAIIIADTSALISLLLPGDHNHTVAVAAAKKLQDKHKDILVPSAVLVEFLNILGRKVSHSVAAAVMPGILTPPFLLISEPAGPLYDTALQKFK